MSCNRGKTDGETKKSNRKCFFQQKCFWFEPKTFSIISCVSFVEKHEGNKWRNTKNLIKNFKFLFCFSRFAQALKTHKPLLLAIICDFLRVKDIGEWLVERDASISVFFINFCNLLETKKIIKPLLYVSWNVISAESKTFFCWISDSPSITQFKSFN